MGQHIEFSNGVAERVAQMFVGSTFGVMLGIPVTSDSHQAVLQHR